MVSTIEVVCFVFDGGRQKNFYILCLRTFIDDNCQCAGVYIHIYIYILRKPLATVMQCIFLFSRYISLIIQINRALFVQWTG